MHVAKALQQTHFEPATEDVPSRLDMAYLEKLKLTGRLPCWQELAEQGKKEKAND